MAHDKEVGFAECPLVALGKDLMAVRFVDGRRHVACLPSVSQPALGKDGTLLSAGCLPRARAQGTRYNLCLPCVQGLPSAVFLALGK